MSDNRDEHSGDVYEMLWDCRFCGTTKLLGKTHRFCPACGSPQDPSWRYYPGDDEKIAVKDHVFVGTDKTCAACGTLNAGNAEFCPRCGAPQTDSAQVKQLGQRSAAKAEKLEREDLTARQDAETAIAVSGIAQTAPQKRGGIKGWQIGLIAAVLLAIVGGGLFALFSTRESSVYVSGFRWERSIDVEEMRAVTESRECDSMPSGAYEVDRRREQVDTRRIEDGETCRRVQVDQGDGTFREREQCETKYREEPVYGDVCYYTVDRWDFDRTVKSEGDKNREPFWQDLNLRRTGSCLGCEREVDDSRQESYLLVLSGDNGTEYECAVEREVWDSTALESTWKLQIGSIMGDARCDTLQPLD